MRQVIDGGPESWTVVTADKRSDLYNVLGPGVAQLGIKQTSSGDMCVLGVVYAAAPPSTASDEFRVKAMKMALDHGQLKRLPVGEYDMHRLGSPLLFLK